MDIESKDNSSKLSAHFFRTEYGKMVSVISKYIGTENLETAEDIVQDTLLKAVEYWQHKGIPENPQAWLYTTAKNLIFNALKRKKYNEKYISEQEHNQTSKINFSEHAIADEQLRVMFVCCHPSISNDTQIALILKILCGLSISEISNAFFTSSETISKRLVRGRKQLRENKQLFKTSATINSHLEVVLTTIYLLFNEGYNPAQKNELIRLDFCTESIRLTEILVNHTLVKEKGTCHALLALMCFNASRFKARLNDSNAIIEMEKQDRTIWNQELINKGIHHLNQVTKEKKISKYHLLASISANHCIAASFDETNWVEILNLYDSLLKLEDSPIVHLNRCVAMAKVSGNKHAIFEMKKLESNFDLQDHYLLHSTLGELYRLENDPEMAKTHFERAIYLTKNERNIKFLKKKRKEVVLDFKSQL